MSSVSPFALEHGTHTADTSIYTFGNAFEDALSENGVLADDILNRPSDLHIEAFVWEKAWQLFCHEKRYSTSLTATLLSVAQNRKLSYA